MPICQYANIAFRTDNRYNSDLWFLGKMITKEPQLWTSLPIESQILDNLCVHSSNNNVKVRLNVVSCDTRMSFICQYPNIQGRMELPATVTSLTTPVALAKTTTLCQTEKTTPSASPTMVTLLTSLPTVRRTSSVPTVTSKDKFTVHSISFESTTITQPSTKESQMYGSSTTGSPMAIGGSPVSSTNGRSQNPITINIPNIMVTSQSSRLTSTQEEGTKTVHPPGATKRFITIGSSLHTKRQSLPTTGSDMADMVIWLAALWLHQLRVLLLLLLTFLTADV